MRLYLDTEFNGFGGELISMALVSKSGSAWYEAVEFNAPVNEWVAQNVIPKLGRAPLLPNEFRASLHEFLRQYDTPEIICDWHADAVHFANALAGDDYGSSLDYACRITILKTPPGEPKPLNPHNALSDAVALCNWHEERLMGWLIEERSAQLRAATVLA